MMSTDSSLITFETLGPLVFVLVLFFIVLGVYRWVDQRWLSPQSKNQKSLHIQEVLFLDPKRRLLRVQDQHQEYLLLLGLQGDLLLHTKPLSSSPKGRPDQ